LDQSALNASNFGASDDAATPAQKTRLLQTKQATPPAICGGAKKHWSLG
jgi:hypothetical protein